MFFTDNSFGQLSQKMQEYYHYINLAELSISDTNYKLATKCYDKAFNINKQSFGIDRYNAAICELKNKNEKKCKTHLEYLIERGFSLETLNNKKIFKDFFMHKYGVQLLHQKMALIINQELKRQYDSILERDQFFRIKEGSYRVYSDTITKIDILNNIAINKLIQKYGFPSENITGLDFTPPIQIIVMHNCAGSLYGENFNYTTILYDAIYNGFLDVRKGVSLLACSMGDDSTYGNEFAKLILNKLEGSSSNLDSKYGFNIPNNEKEASFDKNRKKIGLCSLSENRKKINFFIKNEEFMMPYDINIYSWSNEKDFKESLQKIILAE